MKQTQIQLTFMIAFEIIKICEIIWNQNDRSLGTIFNIFFLLKLK